MTTAITFSRQKYFCENRPSSSTSYTTIHWLKCCSMSGKWLLISLPISDAVLGKETFRQLASSFCMAIPKNVSFSIAPSLVMVGRSVEQQKKRMNTWRGLGSREGRAAKEESLLTKYPCLVLYGVFPGLLGQCILVTYPRRMAGLWKLAWTKWPETHRLRAIMRPRD